MNQARAEDDYGVSSIELYYSVNGGEEKRVQLQDLKSESATTLSGAHTFFMEEFGLQPGDFISYYAKARDNSSADGGAPKHVKPIGKAFISYHFGEAEEAMVDLIRGLVRSHAIPETLDGQMLGGGELRTAVLAMIKEADCLIALLTRDKELKSEGEWTTFDWPRDELNWARDRNMLTVALVEKGVVIKGAYAQYQRIEFTRENFDKALVDLSHTISIWKRKGAN
jgi:hypothetical protein